MDLKVILTVVAMSLTGGYFVWGMDANIAKVDHRLEQVEQTQQKVVDWLDEEVQRKRAIASQQRLLRYLCKSGKLEGDDCKGVEIAEPDTSEQP